VERAQQTDLREFWALVDLSHDHVSDLLSEYQCYYYWDRIHGSLGKTPIDKVVELGQQTPFWDEVEGGYDPSRELIRIHEYAKDIKLFKLKRSL
jgi:hypothetical protein